MSAKDTSAKGAAPASKDTFSAPIPILITGGAGFIGSAVVNLFSRDQKVVVVDRIGYMSRVANWTYPDNVILAQIDINHKLAIRRVMKQYKTRFILHFAAQTHVCNSFDNVGAFIKDNIKGTNSLLEVCRDYGKIEKFIHVSTDEVYGEVPFEQVDGCKEDATLHPTNPYAATKAAAEHIAMSYFKSYGIHIIMTRGNNVVGEYQHPEKVVPKFIMQLLMGKPLTIHGAGTARRHFCYSGDVAQAFKILLEKGVPGQIYNIGTEEIDYNVLDVAQKLTALINPGQEVKMVTVEDRKFNDRRYHIDCGKLKEMGWELTTTFDQALEKTVAFYREHFDEYKALMI
jgi:UDP-glucose 4,6-dehydratase